MLARTADNLYWLSRYMERADFLARIVQATQRLTSLPVDYTQPGHGTEWESALEASGAAVDEEHVLDYLTFSVENPTSIRNCIEYARSNARSVRTALTIEMWEAIN